MTFFLKFWLHFWLATALTDAQFFRGCIVLFILRVQRQYEFKILLLNRVQIRVANPTKRKTKNERRKIKVSSLTSITLEKRCQYKDHPKKKDALWIKKFRVLFILSDTRERSTESKLYLPFPIGSGAVLFFYGRSNPSSRPRARSGSRKLLTIDTSRRIREFEYSCTLLHRIRVFFLFFRIYIYICRFYKRRLSRGPCDRRLY